MNELKITNLNFKDQVSLFHHWRIIDAIEDFSAVFRAGTINGIVGELGEGGWLLSYLLSGRVNNNLSISNHILIDGGAATNEILRRISCYVGEGVAEAPFRNLSRYPRLFLRKILQIKTVSEHIKHGILSTNCRISFNEVVDMFDLTGLYENNEKFGRINRPLEFQSGEVWRASMAIGIAYQKKLFCFPWLEPDFINYILSVENRKYIEILKNMGATIIIPVSNETYLENLADQIIDLKKPKISLS